jgi:HK97 family phage prohead protease
MEIERRFFNVAELRASMEGEHKPFIEGHAAVFNQPSLEIFPFAPGWREVIRPGAFTAAIKTDDVRALINHNDDRLIGRVSNRTLMLEEDEVGLKVRIFPPDTSDARDLLTLIRGKYISQMSFGFRVAEDGEEIDRGGKLRAIKTIQNLYDVSPVTQPAYPTTDVGLRSRFTAQKEPSDVRQIAAEIINRAEFISRSQDRKEIIERAQNYLSQRRINYVVRY